MMPPSDRRALLERARQGDRKSLGELLESFGPYVRSLLRSLGHERLQARVGASDLMQDALLEALRGFPEFQGSTVEEFTGWLRQILFRTIGHALRDHLHTEKRAADRELPAAGMADVLLDSATSPSGRASRNELAATMTQALARLPNDMRQVLLWRHVDGLPHAVIAERLGRSEVAVRALYTRALRQLRELSTDPGPGRVPGSGEMAQ